MTVYVDDMYLYPMGRFGRMKMSHMIADTDAELHAMADRIGVARKWHQAPPKHDSHYDIAQAMRTRAIEFGAVEITLKDCAMMTVGRRRGEGDALLSADEGRAFILAAMSPETRAIRRAAKDAVQAALAAVAQ